VIKRYNDKGPAHSLRHTIKGSRAKKCWRFGHRLTLAGIACAKPLAFVEQRRCGLIRQSYVINAFIAGTDLRRHFAEASERQKQDMTAKALGLLGQLFESRMTHGDLKPGNILIAEDRPVLIDLDSMQFHHCTWMLHRRFLKMLDCFHKRIAEI
jgi:tRNA A-37 threonylcarbamoyl transferase component Bud32